MLATAARSARIFLAVRELRARTELARALRNAGYGVVEVSDDLRLLDRLASGLVATRRSPLNDVVITDADMGGLAGADLLVAMHHRLHSATLVVLADRADAQAHADAIRVGAGAVVDAPVSFAALSRALRIASSAAHMHGA